MIEITSWIKLNKKKKRRIDKFESDQEKFEKKIAAKALADQERLNRRMLPPVYPMYPERSPFPSVEKIDNFIDFGNGDSVKRYLVTNTNNEAIGYAYLLR